MLLMPTHPYKQPLGVWISSKQDDDLNQHKLQGKYRIKSRHQIYVKTPCGEKPRAATSNPLFEEAIQEMRANKDREAPNPP